MLNFWRNINLILRESIKTKKTFFRKGSPNTSENRTTQQNKTLGRSRQRITDTSEDYAIPQNQVLQSYAETLIRGNRLQNAHLRAIRENSKQHHNNQ